MDRIYVVLSHLDEISKDRHIDFSFSPDDLFPTESPLCFVFSRSDVPKGAAVLEWSESTRRFIRQLNWAN